MIAIEIIGVQEKPDAAAGLITDSRALRISGRLREEDAGVGARGRDRPRVLA